MKKGTLLRLLACSALAFSMSSVMANITVHLKPVPGSSDACASLTGNWSGSADVSVQSFLGTVHCKYSGAGVLTSVQNGDGYTVDGKLDSFTKVSGSSLCPTEMTETEISGTCHNNELVFQTDEMQLNGNITGDSATLNGAGDVYGMYAQLSITMSKVSV